MASGIGRRHFISALGGAVAAWPLTAHSQQPGLPVVGFVRSDSLPGAQKLVTAFRQGLKEEGFVEGQNVALELRFADNHADRVPALIAEVVRRPAAAIVGNVATMLAAKAATATVPIVFVDGGDPVRDGLVVSMNRPDGNVTGVSFLAAVVGAKRLELLRQLVPNATTVGVLVNAHDPNTEADRRDVQSVPLAMGQQLIILDASSDADIENAFATFVARGAGALFVGSGAFMFGHRDQLVALAARYALPASYSNPDAVEAGGLTSYGGSIADAYRQAGLYTGRILKGEKPADLPVMQSSKFEFAINLKTAKSLGLAVPQPLLVAADEVIE